MYALIFVLTGKPSAVSKLGQFIPMFFSETYCLDLLYIDGLGNLICMLNKHVMPTPPLPTHLVRQAWHKALPSVFVICVSGAGRLGELQLHGWTPVL